MNPLLSFCTDRLRRGAAAFGLAFAALALSPAGHAAAQQDFLDPAQAFQGQVSLSPQQDVLTVTMTVAPGYHLYRDRFHLTAPPELALPKAELPGGKQEFDTNFNQTMTLWSGTVQVRQSLPADTRPGTLSLRYQGCADRGLCYPPQHASIVLSCDAQGRLQATWEAGQDMFAQPAVAPVAKAEAPPASASAAPPADRSAAALQSGSLLKVSGIFLLGGLLLSFTPCVLPMLPILSSIIVGQGTPVSRLRGFTLALAYSLGMATVYTAAGVVAGLLGSGFAAALQNPWVLGSFALILCLLSLSMFGVWEFQMPGFIQNRVNNASNRLSGGRHAAVFLMGGLSALLVGPCVAAPLAGALVYISQSRDVLLGGTALFALAAGMSVPLLLLGLSAGTLLPRAGRWMELVKTFFGLLLLLTALWLVSPVLPMPVLMFVLGGGALVALFGLGAFEAGKHRLMRGASAVVALWGVALLAGALSGGDSLVQPLRHLARADGGLLQSANAANAAPQFQRITRVAELDAALASAGRPVMLDFYADWCVACKEMEHLTFADPAIQPRLKNALLLQADVTADSAEAKALLKRFQLFGPPGVLFFDARGREIPAARTIGFESAADFAKRLDLAAL